MNQDLETLNLVKNQDSERASSKNRDRNRHITAKSTKLQDLGNLTKILRDPEFLKDHLPSLKDKPTQQKVLPFGLYQY